MATSAARKRYLATPNGKAKHQAYTLRWRAANRKTGKVRGILCNGCNAALGQTKDNPVVLRQLADYLELGV